MSAGELDMEKTDFSMTNATTFDHHSAKITAFFIQASRRLGEARCREARDAPTYECMPARPFAVQS